MTAKTVSVPSVEALPEGCKKVKLTNVGPATIFITFGDASVVGTDQGNRLDMGELELSVPKDATHMALMSRLPTSVSYDAGAAHKVAAHHDDDDDHHVQKAKKR